MIINKHMHRYARAHIDRRELYILNRGDAIDGEKNAPTIRMIVAICRSNCFVEKSMSA